MAPKLLHLNPIPIILRRTPHHQNHPFTTLNHPYESSNQTISFLKSISSNPSYILLGIAKNLESLRKVHALLIVNGTMTNDLLCMTKLVSMYGSMSRVEAARAVFDGIERPDLYAYKVMIRWCFLNEMYGETVMQYRCLRKCLRGSDDVVFAVVLKACCELRDLEEGRKVHCEVVKAGSIDGFVLTSLVDLYAKCGEVGSSREAFGEIKERDVVSWTSLIAGYVQNDCVEEALVMFNRMREGFVEGNQFTLGSLVNGCGKIGALHQGKWLHGCVIKTGMDSNPFLGTALLDMYVKCGNVGDACSVFDDLSTTDVISWTAMIVGYAQTGKPDEALRLLVDKRWAGILLNAVTAASVLSACAQLGSFGLGRTVHCLTLKFGLRDDAVENALVDMYAKCHAIRDARSIFDSVSLKDTTAWNSMISGYYQNGQGCDALQLFHQMILDDAERPDPVTFVSIISACASIGAISVGTSIHAFIVKAGISSVNPYVGTALLNFYAKCGDAVSARLVFDEMQVKNAVTWSAMISGYGIQGDGDESIALLADMSRESMEPNEAIFATVLSACSHTGKVGDGGKYFTSMCQKYSFAPSMKHYACMVDLLARAGRLNEALDFIQGMPIQPDASVYGPFLHGCSLHGRFELGDVAARRMLDPYPDEACYYVLLSNYYALDGRWNQARELRDLMKQRGLSKSPGWSSAEIGTLDEVSHLRIAAIG
ncbi:hypothetical protein Drorol1_Dr00018818 [Drosera rotundifolia]